MEDYQGEIILYWGKCNMPQKDSSYNVEKTECEH